MDARPRFWYKLKTMQALSLPDVRDVKPELCCRDVLVACVTENDPESLRQSLRLVQSIRWLGGELADAQVRICVVGGLGRSFRRDFERYGAELRIVSPLRLHDRDARLEILPEVWESDREMLLLLDHDSVVVQDPLPWMRRGAFRRGAEAPVELDFRLDRPPASSPKELFAVDPAILRYGDRVDSEGYLLHTPYPFAQVRIEAFNRRLRREMEGRAGQAPKARERSRERPAPAAAPGAQVAVLGMHRSGTSALTSLLQSMGFWAGGEEDFPPADDHNEAGYWEYRGVWSIDEAILRTLGTSWSGSVDLDLSRLQEGTRALFQERARKVVEDLDRQGPWVVKDPRLCLLFPFWREILERPFCVLIYRDPLPVARSLAARDRFAIPFGIALWERYTREALASTRGVPRVLISHRELMADPEATLRRLHRHLARHSPELAARLRVPAAEEVRAVLDPSLVHHPPAPEVERSYLNPPQIALLEALADGSALDLDPVPPLSAGARDLLAAYQSLLAATHDLRDQLARQTHRSEGLQQAQEKLRTAHEKALASDAAALHRAHSWLDELDALFSAVLESRSWRIGRAVTRMMGRLLGRQPQISAPERRDRLMDKVRRWRQDHAGD